MMCQVLSHNLGCSAKTHGNLTPKWVIKMAVICLTTRCTVMSLWCEKLTISHSCAWLQLFLSHAGLWKSLTVEHKKKMYVFISFTWLLCFICFSFAVRLHDSISEEGFHYLVFDLWVYFVHTRARALWHFIHACDCGLLTTFPPLSHSPLPLCSFPPLSLLYSIPPSLPPPSQSDRGGAVWRHCRQDRKSVV